MPGMGGGRCNYVITKYHKKTKQTSKLTNTTGMQTHTCAFFSSRSEQLRLFRRPCLQVAMHQPCALPR